MTPRPGKRPKKYNGEAIILDEGNALARYDKENIEDGERITIRFWEMYNAVPPASFRIAVFSYTLLSSQMTQAKYIEELEMLDREIANARFSTSLGTIG